MPKGHGQYNTGSGFFVFGCPCMKTNETKLFRDKHTQQAYVRLHYKKCDKRGNGDMAHFSPRVESLTSASNAERINSVISLVSKYGVIGVSK